MHSLTPSLTHSLTRSLTHSLTRLLTRSLIHSLTRLLTRSLTHSLTHSLTQPLTRSLTLHSLTHLLTRLLTHSVARLPSLSLPSLQPTRVHTWQLRATASASRALGPRLFTPAFCSSATRATVSGARACALAAPTAPGLAPRPLAKVTHPSPSQERDYSLFHV